MYVNGVYFQAVYYIVWCGMWYIICLTQFLWWFFEHVSLSFEMDVKLSNENTWFLTFWLPTRSYNNCPTLLFISDSLTYTRKKHTAYRHHNGGFLISEHDVTNHIFGSTKSLNYRGYASAISWSGFGVSIKMSVHLKQSQSYGRLSTLYAYRRNNDV